MNTLEQIIKQLGDFLNDYPEVVYLIIMTIIIYLGVFFIVEFVERARKIKEYISTKQRNRKKENLLNIRQRIAGYLEQKIYALNDSERWQDARFTELEAEVEAEGRHRKFSFNPFKRYRKGSYRVKALSKALEISEEPYILVVGDPGSGKSVALRYVARLMATKVKDSRSLNAVIPIYLNLKELERRRITKRGLDKLQVDRLEFIDWLDKNIQANDELRRLCLELKINFHNLPGDNLMGRRTELFNRCERKELLFELRQACQKLFPKFNRSTVLAEQPIDAELIKSFVEKTLKDLDKVEIDRFLDEEFQSELEQGTLLFLFDSFDELPEILSSTESDTIIQSYSTAIESFLKTTDCRGVVASRIFRGPSLGWPRFKILELSTSRREQLIKKANLTYEDEKRLLGELGGTNKEDEKWLVGGLRGANKEVRKMAKNPLFLGLLCQYMASRHLFPENTHDVFSNYVTGRLYRDQNRIKYRAGISDVTQLREFTERVAYSMTAEELSLTPTRNQLRHAMANQGFEIDGVLFNKFLDTLEYIKLARQEITYASNQNSQFTFVHRRFQEYFASCLVLREPDRVSPDDLLTDYRWRETAVTMIQSQIGIEKLLDKTVALLTEFMDQVLIEDQQVSAIIDVSPEEYIKRNKQKVDGMKNIVYPFKLLHILELLQDGFYSQPDRLPNKIRQLTNQIVLSLNQGFSLEREDSLSVAGIASPSVLLWLIKQAFNSPYNNIKKIAYQQAGHLTTMSQEIIDGIRSMLIDLHLEKKLYQDKYAIKAYIARLPALGNLTQTVDLLLKSRYIDKILHIGGFLFVIITLPLFVTDQQVYFIINTVTAISFVLSYRFLWQLNITYETIKFAIAVRIFSFSSVLIIYFTHIPYPINLFYAFTSFYVINWMVIVVYAAKAGKFIQWWPIFPMWPLLILYKTMMFLTKKLMKAYRLLAGSLVNVLNSKPKILQISTSELEFKKYLLFEDFKNKKNESYKYIRESVEHFFDNLIDNIKALFSFVIALPAVTIVCFAAIYILGHLYSFVDRTLNTQPVNNFFRSTKDMFEVGGVYLFVFITIFVIVLSGVYGAIYTFTWYKEWHDEQKKWKKWKNEPKKKLDTEKFLEKLSTFNNNKSLKYLNDVCIHNALEHSSNIKPIQELARTVEKSLYRKLDDFELNNCKIDIQSWGPEHVDYLNRIIKQLRTEK